ncbi:MAG: tyrosine-type recombinase/integrase [Bryobacterales bacterium]|nr:tyrosine-type recombinase/integrase [Bryobacterales bacterium]
MTLFEATDTFLELKRSLGAKYAAEGRVLRAFGRAMGDIGLDEIQPEAVRAFCRGSGPPTLWLVRKHYALQVFFKHLALRGLIATSPLPESPPRVPRPFRPRIFSRQELARLLEATSILDSPARPLRKETYRTLLLVLYGAGLRPGEGLRLRVCDVDVDSRLLFVWDSKCFKSRIVPVGTALGEALATYLRARRTLPMPSGQMSFFFASPRGGGISLASLEAAWVRLREQANVCNPPSARWQPRLQDLRHNFATHRLVAWYREGADVQARLPWLATYLGHVTLAGTQAYLSMTPELLAEASQRFERYADIGDEGAMPCPSNI